MSEENTATHGDVVAAYGLGFARAALGVRDDGGEAVAVTAQAAEIMRLRGQLQAVRAIVTHAHENTSRDLLCQAVLDQLGEDGPLEGGDPWGAYGADDYDDGTLPDPENAITGRTPGGLDEDDRADADL